MKRTAPVTLTAALMVLAWSVPVAAETPDAASPAAQAEYQQILEDAERARAEAEAARREAQKISERAREVARVEAERAQLQAERAAVATEEQAREQAERQREMDRVRDELSRTHRELREASREVARAHRELARAETEREQALRVLNLGDRAVIGVVLGGPGENGVELIGVSPDGPAEKAGIQAGDVITAIDGQDLGSGAHARARLFEVMEGAKAGDALKIAVQRDGKPLEFTVTAEIREPSSWQSIIRIPEIARLEVPEIDGDAEIIVERMRVPEIDHEALKEKMAELRERLKAQKFVFVDPEGGSHAWSGDIEFEFEDFSDYADHAFADADIWFGLPHTRGLEFAAMNAQLGEYFKTERGVLVLRAEDENAYGLRAGDVILEVGGEAVDTPAELMRALRRAEPGELLVVEIKRERRNKTLEITMPEKRLGLR